LKTLKENHDVDIHWRSFELRPVAAPPVPDWYRQKVLAARPQFIATMRENFGVEIKFGPWGINSRPALIGHKVALEHGRGDEYHDATLEAYWLEGLSLEDRDVLEGIAEKVALDVPTFIQGLDEPQYDQMVTNDVMMAHMSGIDAVPALVFKEKYLFKGAGTYETLVMMLDRIQQIEAEEAEK
jgi:predicted DsbA family dithiol-disulfide isomerase